MAYRPDLPLDERVAELRLLRTRAEFTGDQRAVRRIDSKLAWIEAGRPDIAPQDRRKTPKRRGRGSR